MEVIPFLCSIKSQPSAMFYYPIFKKRITRPSHDIFLRVAFYFESFWKVQGISFRIGKLDEYRVRLFFMQVVLVLKRCRLC